MTTIEEAAKKLADTLAVEEPKGLVYNAFKEGANWALQNQWHDASKELPDDNEQVIGRYFYGCEDHSCHDDKIVYCQTNGKRWNADKKCIEDIKKEYQFKPFDRVLVRDEIEETWEINFLSHKAFKYDGYQCLDRCYLYCVPYNGNEELLGTTNSPI